jgi:hypothetical protein
VAHRLTARDVRLAFESHPTHALKDDGPGASRQPCTSLRSTALWMGTSAVAAYCSHVQKAHSDRSWADLSIATLRDAAAIQAEIAALGETPLNYMLRVMRDEAAEPARRAAMTWWRPLCPPAFCSVAHKHTPIAGPRLARYLSNL